MTYHITVSIVNYNEIELLSIDSFHQLIFHFVSAHFGFQVVSSHLRRRNQNTLFSIIRSFTTTIEEESYMGILLCFCNMKLSFAVGSQVFAQCVVNIFFIKQNVNALK